jgi:hypothetical protein
MFVHRKDEATRKWRRLPSEELYDLYCSTNITPVIEPKIMRWTRRVARMGISRGELHTGLGGETGGKETTWRTLA